MDHLRRAGIRALGCQLAAAARPIRVHPSAVLAGASAWFLGSPRAADTRVPVHALLIGCGRYAGLGPSYQLPGAEADVGLMRRALLSAYGDRLSVLALDSADAAQAPTHRAVLQALDVWAAQTPPGAIAWLYMAGHGTRRPQPARETAYREPDGADEFFLPMDAGRWQAGTEAVARSIRDDEIQQRLQRLQQRDVRVVAWFDTCHAAGMDRGALSAESPGATVVPGTRARAVDIALLGGPPASGLAAQRAAAASERVADSKALAYGTHRDLRRLTLLYACRKHEQAFEGWVRDAQGRRRRQGWFTWYALQVWRALREGAQPWAMAQFQQRVIRAYAAVGIAASNPQLLGDAAPLQQGVWR